MNLSDWIFIIILIGLCTASFWAPYDDTDDKVAKERSGLSLFIDHRTGCHYLKAGIFGGITPRLDQDGNHICDGDS